MFRQLYFRLSPKGRRIVRRLYYFPQDLFARIFHKSDPLVPPKGMTFVGSGNFELIGDKFANHIINTIPIRPEEIILDVGCGIGRIARPFAKILDKNGQYYGFDIINYGVNWCNKNYKKYPNFRFEYFPLINDLYNLEADKNAEDFEFPYPENSFGLVVLISVFTHMQKNEVLNYLKQIYRVLKPGGYCYATFFLIDDEVGQNLFPYTFDDYSLHNLKVKNANVAFRKNFIMQQCELQGFITETTFKGWWNNGHPTDAPDFQDIIVLKKPL